MSLFRPVHHTFAPHVTGRYLLKSIGLLFLPLRLRNGKSREKLRENLQNIFSGDIALFSTGREALLAGLLSLHIEQEDEIIVQAYTCVIVPNAIKAAGGIPVYADIDKETLNLNCDDVERKVTDRTNAIICQHTFGIPADTTRLRELCDRHGILLIEDCAHIIPDKSGPENIGKHGDILICSFGRDKAISGVSGGAIACRKPELFSEIQDLEKHAPNLPILTIKRLLLYPLFYSVCKPFYGLWIGKALLGILRKLHLLIPVTSTREKEGIMKTSVHTIPNALCALTLNELKDLKILNDHRRKLVAEYLHIASSDHWDVPSAIHSSLPLQKFPMFVDNPDAVRNTLKKKNVYLDDGWTGAVVCPRSSSKQAVGYSEGSCPIAEEVGRSILSLPTHPTTKNVFHLLQ